MANVLMAGYQSLKGNGGRPPKDAAGKGKDKGKKKQSSTPPNDGQQQAQAPKAEADPKPTSSVSCIKTEFSKEEEKGIRSYIRNGLSDDIIDAIDGLGETDELRDAVELLVARCPEIREVVSRDTWKLVERAYGKVSKKWYPASKEETYWDDGNEETFNLKWIWVSSRGFERDATAEEIKDHGEKLRQEKIAAARKRKANSSADPAGTPDTP